VQYILPATQWGKGVQNGERETQIGGRGKYFLTTNTEMKQKYTNNYYAFKCALCIWLVNSNFID
jgi:hypothetical protein